MSTQRKCFAATIVAVVGAAMTTALIIACSDPTGANSPPPVVKLRTCDIVPDPSWPGIKGAFTLDVPTGCPLTLPGSNQRVHYTATAEFAYNSNYSRIHNTVFTDDGGAQILSQSVQGTWRYTQPPDGFGADTIDYLDFDGAYNAGDSLSVGTNTRCGNPNVYLCKDGVVSLWRTRGLRCSRHSAELPFVLHRAHIA